LQLYEELCEACKEANIEKIRELIEKKECPVNIVDAIPGVSLETNMTPLQELICGSGDIECIKYLIQKKSSCKYI